MASEPAIPINQPAKHRGDAAAIGHPADTLTDSSVGPSAASGGSTLILLRHGKSGYPAGVADHDRPLGERGLREARLAARWMREEGLAPDAIICSTATRARETLTATGFDAPTRFDADIYDNTTEAVRGAIAREASGARTVLLVGHFPALPLLAMELDPAAEISEFKTSAYAVLTTGQAWADLSSAHLVGVRTPRD